MPTSQDATEYKSSLRAGGSRNHVQQADVSGRFTTPRRASFAALIAVFLAMPWIRIAGHPAVFLNVAERRFYLFGLTFNAQDFWLVFFLLTGIGFALIVATTLVGRVWCGYACPQTVFLDGVYLRIERLIEGPRNERVRRNKKPMSWDKAWRKVSKQCLFILVSFALSHALLSHFVSIPGLVQMIQAGPAAHPEAFAWATILGGLFYFNFAWFREQLCLIVCPYGRLQSVLTDMDTVVVGYDETRGEPRGKKSDPKAGDCVACNRCVVVCPTGIDIRNGLQIDCIGCAACIDACDDVMKRVGRPQGLVRYDSLRVFAGERKSRIFRPRIVLYAALGVVGLVVTTVAVSSRKSFEANLLRMAGPPYIVEDESVRNSFEVHLVNKSGDDETFEISGSPNNAVDYTIATPSVKLESLESQRIPVFVRGPAKGRDFTSVTVQVCTASKEATCRNLQAPFLAPNTP